MKELLEAWLAELFKREYAFATIMFTKYIFLAIGLNDGCVKIIDLSISKHNLTSMACHY